MDWTKYNGKCLKHIQKQFICVATDCNSKIAVVSKAKEGEFNYVWIKVNKNKLITRFIHNK